MRKVVSLLEPKGCILAHEPTRDRYTEATAAIVHLIRTLLAAGDGFFVSEPIPSNPDDQDKAIMRLLQDLKYEGAGGEKKQSVNDNEAGYSDMIEALNAYFDCKLLKERYAFFHEIIGGLRFTKEVNIKLANYLHDLDARLCRLNVIPATEFFYAGRCKTV